MLQPLTIFEGPDCSGKSTAAYEFWKEGHVGCRLVPHGPYPGVTKMLPRLYVETMLPMLMGGAGQIWDRSWYSEPIYGNAFRHGQDRVGTVNKRHLERFALRHGAVVVLCLPPWETVEASWKARQGDEYLDTVDQLRLVYEDYDSLPRWCHLPMVLYDYTRHDIEKLTKAINRAREGIFEHDATIHAGGNPNARIVLVGDKFSDLKDEDCDWRLPFASFNGNGSSTWLTKKLDELGVREHHLLWVNADQQLGWLANRHNEVVVALGKAAAAKLTEGNIAHVEVEHPQYFKRFRENDPTAVYALFDLLESYSS